MMKSGPGREGYGTKGSGNYETVLSFIDTVEHRNSEPIELWDSQEAFVAWLKNNGFESSAGNLDIRDLDLPGIINFREAVYRYLKCLVTGTVPHSDDVETINTMLALTRKTTRMTSSFELVEVPTTLTPLQEILSRVALNLARFVTAGERGRLRICGNPECGVIFYDTSKSSKRKWCNMKTCGNRNKVRLLRMRKRDGQDRLDTWS